MRSRILLVLALTSTTSIAIAQGSIVRATVQGPGGLCLAVRGTFTEATPAPEGTPVILATCDGSDAQRWWIGFGDYQGSLQALGHLEIQGNAEHAAVLARYAHATRISNGQIRTSTGCLTSSESPVSGAPLKVMPCDGRPTQHFTETLLR